MANGESMANEANTLNNLRRSFLTGLVTLSDLIQEWLPQRRESLGFTRRIADELDAKNANANIAKMVGSGAGATGAVLMGAGALAALSTGPVAPLLYYGLAAVVGGGIVSYGAERKRILDSKELVQQVSNALEDDARKQREIQNKSGELKDLITKISQKEGVSIEEALQNLLKEVLAQEGNSGGQGPACEELRGFNETHVSRLTMIPGLQNLSRDAVINLAAFLEVPELFARTLARGATAVVASPIILVIDMYQFLTSAKDFNEGSKSEAATELRGLADKLKAELRAYEKIQEKGGSTNQNDLPNAALMDEEKPLAITKIHKGKIYRKT